MISCKVGDYVIDSEHKDVWKILKMNGEEFNAVCIDHGISSWSVGDISFFNRNYKYWEVIKMKNKVFTTLYQKLL